MSFDVDPDIGASSGDLTFTTALHANGSFTVDIDVTDDNGTPADARRRDERLVTVTVNVTDANDAPTVTPVNQSLPEDDGAQTVTAAQWSSA